MEDFSGMSIGDVNLQDFYNQLAKEEKTEHPDGGDYQKNFITIIHHQKPRATSKSDIDELFTKGELVPRRSSEVITAVQSYADPSQVDEDEDTSAFDLSNAAMIAELMDMFEREIRYNSTDLNNIPSEDEDLKMLEKPSTSRC